MSQDVEPHSNSENKPRRLRATDAQRRHTASLLSQAFSTGQLSLEEFDERTALAFNAVHTTDLEPLTADLAVPEKEVPASYTAPAAETQQGSSFSLAILSSARRNNWLIPPNHTSIAILGDVHLDLYSAEFQTADTTITCFATLGDVVIIAPPDVEIIVEGVGVLGNFVKKSYFRPENPTRRVRLTGLALLGDVKVKRPRSA